MASWGRAKGAPPWAANLDIKDYYRTKIDKNKTPEANYFKVYGEGLIVLVSKTPGSPVSRIKIIKVIQGYSTLQ